MDIEQLYEKAVGFEPYDFQRRVAEKGLPELLQVPTGCGKTEAVGLGWLYRRRFHADDGVRSSTPHWLVLTLPMRTLVEQTAERFKGWLERLDLGGEVGLHIVQGGIGWSDRDWRLSPERDAVFVGTVDMLLSRALNRGYGDSRWNWPMSFGGFNNGAHWVFDEIQLMDLATPNTRQLQSFRDALGTALPTASTWMSATVDHRLLQTVDRPDVKPRITLSSCDRNGRLAQRLEAVRTVREVKLPAKQREKALAQELVDHHSPGTLTLAVFNTVDSAIKSWRALKKAAPANEIVLLHSRYRPTDRAEHMQKVLSPLGPAGRIVMSTQVLEAGVDLSARVLFTEAASWPSIVQRAGRCNRDGRSSDSELLWAEPPKALPYEEADVQASTAALRSLEYQEVIVEQLQNHRVPVSSQITPVIRRKDLIELFDTTPDLSGNDIDVARFIRDSGDRTVHVAWREIVNGQPSDEPLCKDELCRVPIAMLSRWLKKNRAWFLDHLSRDRKRPWKRCSLRDLRDGLEVVLDAEEGGYTSDIGWNEKSNKPVEAITVPHSSSVDASSLFNSDVLMGDDPASLASPNGSWYPLDAHLLDVKSECEAILQSLETAGLTEGMREAAITAGWLHDIGKASRIWQKAALATADADKRASVEQGGPYAKTDNNKRLWYERRFFRHELASALALMNEGASALHGLRESNLVVYLVAAHHGRVRLSIRRLPEESMMNSPASANGTKAVPGQLRSVRVSDADKSAATVSAGKTLSGGTSRESSDAQELVVTTLGIAPTDELPDVDIGGRIVPKSHLSIPKGSERYERRSLELRDRSDLGPFRLAFMELIVRSADWRASRSAETSS